MGAAGTLACENELVQVTSSNATTSSSSSTQSSMQLNYLVIVDTQTTVVKRNATEISMLWDFFSQVTPGFSLTLGPAPSCHACTTQQLGDLPGSRARQSVAYNSTGSSTPAQHVHTNEQAADMCGRWWSLGTLQRVLERVKTTCSYQASPSHRPCIARALPRRQRADTRPDARSRM
jgi:hypothetical protein